MTIELCQRHHVDGNADDDDGDDDEIGAAVEWAEAIEVWSHMFDRWTNYEQMLMVCQVSDPEWSLSNRIDDVETMVSEIYR